MEIGRTQVLPGESSRRDLSFFIRGTKSGGGRRAAWNRRPRWRAAPAAFVGSTDVRPRPTGRSMGKWIFGGSHPVPLTGYRSRVADIGKPSRVSLSKLLLQNILKRSFQTGLHRPHLPAKTFVAHSVIFHL